MWNDDITRLESDLLCPRSDDTATLLLHCTQHYPAAGYYHGEVNSSILSSLLFCVPLPHPPVFFHVLSSSSSLFLSSPFLTPPPCPPQQGEQ